jgi:hypothetical protein
MVASSVTGIWQYGCIARITRVSVLTSIEDYGTSGTSGQGEKNRCGSVASSFWEQSTS